MAGVRTTHKDYDRFSPKWKRARAAVEGQDAIHAGGTEYLPKLSLEEDGADYQSRVKRSDFFNGTWRTIDALSGMAFRKPPTVEIPKGIEPYFDDVTLSGVSMEAFAKEMLEEDLSLGRVGILVDHPPQPGNLTALTVDAAQRLGLRPTLQLYTTENIRNWKFARVNNAWVLSMVVLGEVARFTDPKDEFAEETEDRYRVLDLDAGGYYRQRLFRIAKDGKDEQIGGDIYPLKNNQPLTAIPFFIVGANGKGDCIDEPPLIDLIDANIALYQMRSTQRHTLYFCPPTFCISGYVADGKQSISVGGTTALLFPDPNAKAYYAEPEGKLIEQLREAMKDQMQSMALLGARMIADETKQVETLGATQIKRAGENSVLAKIVQAVSEALEEALTLFADWAGHPDSAIVYQINRDFMPAMMDAQSLSALFTGVMSGNISKPEVFTLLQRGDLIDGEKTYEEHQAEIEISTPSPARPTPKEPGAQAA